MLDSLLPPLLWASENYFQANNYTSEIPKATQEKRSHKDAFSLYEVAQLCRKKHRFKNPTYSIFGHLCKTCMSVFQLKTENQLDLWGDSPLFYGKFYAYCTSPRSVGKLVLCCTVLFKDATTICKTICFAFFILPIVAKAVCWVIPTTTVNKDMDMPCDVAWVNDQGSGPHRAQRQTRLVLALNL